MIVAVFFNVKLYLYHQKISLTQKVLAQEREVKIKTSISLENSASCNFYHLLFFRYSSYKIRNSSSVIEEITSESHFIKWHSHIILRPVLF